MSYNYIVTANRASAVSNSITGNFTGPDDINLITSRLSRIEISKITPGGLKTIHEVGVYGRIEAIRLFRPPGHNKDLMFMLTNKYHVAILECIDGPQPDTIDIITRRSGNIADPASRPAETGNIVIIDPACKMIGLRLHDGLFKVIPIDKNKSGDLEAFNIRMEEICVPDITFLHGFHNPTIGFIYKESASSTSHVKTYEISLKEREFIIGPWSRENVANEASIIIPVPQPFGGAIIVALESIVYINGEKEKVIAPASMKQSPINCYAQIDKDGKRYLLGDLSGRLFCLILHASDIRPDDSKLEVKEMSLELMGEISSPECITYLDNSIVYVGSKLGDSQLIKLSKTSTEGSFIEVCETYTNLGPISDMCLVDLEKQGQGQLVTCSGYSKDGSIRIIRNGIGINEHASMALPQIKGVWSLKIGEDQRKDNYILLTFIEDSYLWYCEDSGDFDNNLEDDGFERKQRTALCANVAHNQIIQVTRTAIRLISAVNKQLIDLWKLPSTNGIYTVSHNFDHIACADGKLLYYFEITANKLNLLQEKILESEIACLDITPLDPKNQLLSVGLWFNKNIVIYSLPDITELYRVELATDISVIPRSIITAKFEDICYLLCALGDGSVFYFKLDPTSGKLSNCKKVTLGTYETILRPFKSQSTTSIFACSDRPTVIYSSNNKLVFSNVNLKEVNYMCSLDTTCYTDSLALVSDTDILFGTIDEIQKLHIKTIPLYESPVKIVHQQSTQTFGLLSSRVDTPDINGLQPLRPSASTKAHSKSSAVAMSTGVAKPLVACSDLLELDTSNLLIIDQHTFEVLHAHQFMPTEQAISILSAKLGETQEEYFIVGTGFVNQDEPEPKQGRLVVFRWSQDSNLQQIAELGIKGCAYCLCEFENGKFLAGINASVNLVELNSRRDLHIECTHVNATIALYLKRKNDLILMGDLMRSLSLYTYKPLQAHFEEVARDLNPAWMTEVEILDDETFLGAEHQYNIFVCKRDSKATSEQDRAVLQQVGLFHLGDCVNVFHPGSLVVQHPSESSIDIKRATLFGTVEGVVGLILSIDETLFKRLESIQSVLEKLVKSIGKIDHSEWRAFVGNKSSQPAVGFIDGDLVETFLDLSREKMEQVAKELDLPVDELVKTIEELTRLH